MMSWSLGVCLPVFNEAPAIAVTLHELASAVNAQDKIHELHVIIVDDASTDNSTRLAVDAWQQIADPQKTLTLHVVTLTHNQGHQRALLAGLRYAVDLPIDACMIMDADGQDAPEALLSHIGQLRNHDILFAQRTKRAESWLWVVAYHIYQAIFRIMLGKSLNFGNFCVVSKKVLEITAQQGDLTHLAAVLSTMYVPQYVIAVPRRPRLRGETKMSFSKLLDYAASAMTASSVGWIRLFWRLSLVMATLSGFGLISIVGIRLFTQEAISGWASIMSMLAFIVSFQSLGFLVVMSVLQQLTHRLTPISLPQIPEVLQYVRSKDSPRSFKNIG